MLHREDLREATRKAAERRRQHREPLSRLHRLKPGEKKHSKRMATVAAVYTTAPFVRSPDDFLESLMPRQPGDKPRAVRPRPVAKRVWASLEREPWEVVAEATLEAERQDPEHAKRWVVLVDGAEPQLDLVEAGAAAYGVDVTVVLDIIHVVEYVWKAGRVFHREGSPELTHWAWTRVRSILEGKASRVAAAMRRAATVAGLSKDTRKPVDTCADYLLKWVRLFFVDGPRGFCQRHGKSYLTRRRRGGEGGGGGLLTGRAIPSAYRWAWCRWYSRVVEVPVRIEVAAGFVAPGASEPPRLQPSWPPGGSRPAHG